MSHALWIITGNMEAFAPEKGRQMVTLLLLFHSTHQDTEDSQTYLVFRHLHIFLYCVTSPPPFTVSVAVGWLEV